MPLQATSGAASYDAFGGGVAAVPNYIEDVFSTYLYTGNDSTQTITNGIDLAGKGGLVWIKSRTSANFHALFDTGRGATQVLASNSTAAQYTNADTLTSFNSNGFSLKFDSDVNGAPNKYASWTFREQPKFFDVVTYTGDGIANRRISHNLGSAPGCIIVKCTNEAQQWISYHNSLGIDAYLKLNSTDGSTALTSAWGNSAPTSTDFGVNALFTQNKSGNTYVAYLFAHNAGGFGLTGTDNVISCGSFTTNGSGIATVDLGYEPQYFLVKPSSNTGNWEVVDNMRGFNNAGVTSPTNASTSLFPNLSAAETYAGFNASINSNGFTFAGGNSWTYIYIAIRRGPMKVPTSGTSVFSLALYTGNNTNNRTIGSVTTDLAVFANPPANNYGLKMWWDRLRSSNLRLVSTNTNAEGNFSANQPYLYFDQNNALRLGNDPIGFTNQSPYSFVSWMFQRAPSFFDEVCYTGTGGSLTVNHNLGVTPELIITKSRSNTQAWTVQLGGDVNYGVLNSTAAFVYAGDLFTPTATQLNIAATSLVNTGGYTYVAYLFATCAGVSKVGSYTGTGATQIIDCGFTGGARFVLIKCTNDAGAWYVWDSARGMVFGTDPYLLLNSTAAEFSNLPTGSYTQVTSETGGFGLSAAEPNVNINSYSYIFLAIA